MLEKRRAPRVLTLKTGKIVSELLAAEIVTAVLDISDAGACLLVPNVRDVPKTFDPVLDPGAERHACETRWKAGYRVGVRFNGHVD